MSYSGFKKGTPVICGSEKFWHQSPGLRLSSMHKEIMISNLWSNHPNGKETESKARILNIMLEIFKKPHGTKIPGIKSIKFKYTSKKAGSVTLF